MRTVWTPWWVTLAWVLAACSSSGSSDKTPGGSASGGRGRGLASGGTGHDSADAGDSLSGGSGEAQGGNSEAPVGGSSVGGRQDGQSGADSTAGGTGNGPNSGSGGSGNGQGGSSNGQGGSSNGQGGSSGGSGGACVEVGAQSTPLPPILEFVIDVTGSMADQLAYPNDPTNTIHKWPEMQRVLPGVFDGLPDTWAVGVSYFRKPDNGCYSPDQPVPIDLMDSAQKASITASVQARGPKPNTTDANNVQGATPTLAAWRNGLAVLTAWSPPPGYEESPRYIVLITDGVPTVNADGCTYVNPITQAEYDSEIAIVQSEGQAAGVQTYVIGVLGSEQTQNATYDPLYMLSRWALAGGTEQPAGCSPQSGTVDTSVSPTVLTARGSYCHFDMTTNPDFAGGLQDALRAITTQVISCNYDVPVPPDGRFVDPNYIRITYTPSDGVERVLQRASDASCADGQWFAPAQDSFGVPTEIDLCPDTCATARADAGAKVLVTFTCIEQM